MKFNEDIKVFNETIWIKKDFLWNSPGLQVEEDMDEIQDDLEVLDKDLMDFNQGMKSLGKTWLKAENGLMIKLIFIAMFISIFNVRGGEYLFM